MSAAEHPENPDQLADGRVEVGQITVVLEAPPQRAGQVAQRGAPGLAVGEGPGAGPEVLDALVQVLGRAAPLVPAQQCGAEVDQQLGGRRVVRRGDPGGFPEHGDRLVVGLGRIGQLGVQFQRVCQPEQRHRPALVAPRGLLDGLPRDPHALRRGCGAVGLAREVGERQHEVAPVEHSIAVAVVGRGRRGPVVGDRVFQVGQLAAAQVGELRGAAEVVQHPRARRVAVMQHPGGGPEHFGNPGQFGEIEGGDDLVHRRDRVGVALLRAAPGFGLLRFLRGLPVRGRGVRRLGGEPAGAGTAAVLASRPTLQPAEPLVRAACIVCHRTFSCGLLARGTCVATRWGVSRYRRNRPPSSPRALPEIGPVGSCGQRSDSSDLRRRENTRPGSADGPSATIATRAQHVVTPRVGGRMGKHPSKIQIAKIEFRGRQ